MDDANTNAMYVTPEMAKEWLNHNIINRKVQPRRVDSYAVDMASGNWQYNKETIKFNKRGDLVDGQHRLLAIIKSGTSIKTAVVFDIDNDVYIFDRGMNRTTSQSLGMAGMDRSLSNKMVVSVAKLHFILQGSVMNVSDSEIQKFLYRNEEIIRFIDSLPRKKKNGLNAVNTSNAAILLAVFYGIKSSLVEQETARLFLKILESGIPTSLNQTAALVCRNDILNGTIPVKGSSSGFIRKKGVFQIERALYDFANGIARRRTYGSVNEGTYSKLEVCRNA